MKRKDDIKHQHHHVITIIITNLTTLRYEEVLDDLKFSAFPNSENIFGKKELRLVTSMGIPSLKDSEGSSS